MGKEDQINFTRLYRNRDGGGMAFSLVSDIDGNAEGAQSFPALERCSVEFGDVNNDGAIDLLLAGASAGSFITELYFNDGTGSFSPADIPLPGINFGVAMLGDVDNDGDLDVFITGFGGAGYFSKVYINNINPTPPLAEVLAPTNLSADVVGVREVWLSWDAVPGAAYAVYVGTADQTGDGNYNYTYRGTLPLPDAAPAIRWRRMTNEMAPIRTNRWLFRPMGAAEYHWTIQAVNGTLLSSSLPAAETFRPPNSAPTRVTVDRSSPISVPPGAETVVGLLSTSDVDIGDTHTYAISETSAYLSYFFIEGNRLFSRGLVTAEQEEEGKIFVFLIRSTDAEGASVMAPFILRADYGDGPIGAGWLDLAALTDGSSMQAEGKIADSIDKDWHRMHLEAGKRYAFSVVPAGADVSAGLGAPRLTLYGEEVGGDTYPIASSERNADTTTYHLVYQPGRSDDYYLEVAGDRTSGSYRLVVSLLPTPRFVPLEISLPRVAEATVSFADVDNDGDLDFLLAGFASEGSPTHITHLYKGAGDASFVLEDDVDGNEGNGMQQLPGVAGGMHAFGDFDTDGDLDLLLAGVLAEGVSFTELYSNDRGYFVPTPIRAINRDFPGASHGAIALGDVGNDGDLDILMGGAGLSVTQLHERMRPWASGTYQLLGDVDRATDGAQQFPSTAHGDLLFGDVDGNACLDIFLMGLDAMPRLYLDDGTGRFTESLTPVAAEPEPTAFPAMVDGMAAFSDIDGDGDLDLLLVGEAVEGLRSYLYKNTGAGSFTQVEDVDGPGGAANYQIPGVVDGSLLFGDVDNDGDVDFFLTGSTYDTLFSTLYSNDGSGHFSQVDVGLPAAQSSAVAFGDIEGDGDLDLLFAGTGHSGDFSTLYRNDINIPPPVLALPAPTQASFSIEDGRVMLRWEPVPGAFAYDVYVGTLDRSFDGNYDRTVRQTLLRNGRWFRTVSAMGRVQGNEMGVYP